MKALIPSSLIAAIALFAVAYNPAEEQAAPGASEKIAAALPSSPHAKPSAPRKILIFSRTNGFRHESIPTGKIALSELGEKTGAFSSVVSDDLANFEAENISNFDAILFLNTTKNVFAPFKKEMLTMTAEQKKSAKEYELLLKENLMNFVKNGGGFIGIHAATDTFYEWDEYGEMIGGYFDGHPWNKDAAVSIKVEPGQEDHPLVAMFHGENQNFTEEIYQHQAPYDSQKVHMLLRLDTEATNMEVGGIKRTDDDFGVSWAKTWGKGRVFYCSLGHNHEMFWNSKVLSHYLAGIQWSIGDLEAEISESKKP